jgi:cell division protein FtsZ
MLFVAAGMGGGTGTGAAPVIARAAREKNILTVGIVTKPFMFEGSRRMKLAEEGIENLYASVDTMITIPNQNLFRVATENTTMADAFAMADEVLHSGVRGVTDLMVVPGLINLDFNDVRTIMDEMGKAMMGTGEATGERRAVEAAESAINNPLLDDVSLKGAKGVLINITGGRDLTLYEVDEAASLIRGQVDENANIIVGSALDDDLDGIIRVSVVATGVDSEARAMATPSTFSAARPKIEEPALTPAQTAQLEQINARHDRLSGFNPVADMQKEVEQEFTAPIAEETPAPPPYVAPRPYPSQIEAPAQREVSAPVSRAPAPTPPVQQTIPEPTQPPAEKSNFGGFFGFRKKANTPPMKTQTTPAPMGDLFSDDMEDELEIPSFLRRQSR